MKEDSSLRNKMIDGNWILKRKRKRSTSGSDPTKPNEGTSLPSDSPKNIPSVERKLKDDINASRFHHKVKGHDGHYFECIECDLGGNLLCCDSCPRTYHLECLTPPLKRTPPGKWQCPKCCEHKDYFKTINNAVENPRRARSKSTSEKPKTRDKASFSGTRHHFQEENKLNYKGKIIFPEKNSDLTQVGTSHSTRSSHSCDSGSRDGGISTPADRKIEKKPGLKRCRRKISLNSDPSGKSCDEKDDSHKSEMKGKNKLILSLVRSTQKSKKKSQKVRRREKKRSRTEKGKLAANTVLNHTSKEASPTPENKGFLQKHKSFDQLIPGSISKEESRIRKHSGQKLSKISLEGASPSSHGLDEQGVEVDKSVNYHENLLDGDQQVDRILGCRVQSSSMMSSCHTTHTETIKSDTSSRAVDIGDAECKVMILTTISSKDQCVINGNCEVVEGCAINAVDTEERPVSCDIGSINAPTVGTLPDMNNDDTIPTECRPTERDSVMYEFLVKWVGKSNIHNRWVSESELKVLAKRKLDNYMAKYGTAVLNICEEQWCEPQRVIALHVAQDGKEEALVKWRGLPYDESTWERLDEPVIRNSAHLITQFKQFESQTLDKDISRVDQEFVTLMEQPKELQGGSLFPHQLEALNWLRKCWFKSKNVILADEMGLGKTISAAAFISSLYCEFKARLPCLVLVPLSTMPNWLAEFALWAPCVNVVEYHGSAKARSVIRKYEWHKFNVLLTSYEMVLADSSHLRAVSWEVLVVDEGHRLKNSGSKLFGLLNSFSFQHRVLMTGTPLQNNIGEMYNLLNFLQPVSFPSLSAFEEKFTDLTTAEKVEELKKLVAPHMLRRLKKDAMQNIPPKTERIVPVELTSIQAEYYRAMLTKNYQILRNVGKGGVMQSMLNIVMQLRKVCNHPYLIPGTEPESGSVQFLQEMRIKASAKLTLLHSMLKVLRKDGHRILIFSQMTKLLDILEDYLTIEFGPKTFERVDGSVAVADRQAAIARFNQDKTRFVFLLSTRSCGLGINLATADTVIIYDSDFNPHADIQAMNRAHRIGQSNVLLVYRLVVRASVEERILQLAKKKLMLDQLFVNKSESQKDVEDILRWGTEELFSECDNGVGGKDPTESGAVADGEQKHRRRAGGLGDVYEDRFTDDCTKIIWDENAILKLLDRSNIPSAVSESTDLDLDNDMLGSVKSMDWNDDLNEEPGGNELLPGIAGDGCELPSEAKEENAIIGTEENEWDRLLRIRWEKYQTEAEAALGRGKRLRKAISYKETFASIPSDALTEPCGNEEVEAEPEYTPAGRALKEKFAMLRSRQKERLAQRHVTDAISLTEKPIPSVKEWEGSNGSKLVQDTAEHASAINSEDTKFNKSFEARNQNEFIAKPGRFSKYGSKRYHSSHVDHSFKPPGNFSPDKFLPNHQFQSTLLPVLGLCAPNANQVNSASRKLYPLSSQPIPNHEPQRTNGTSEFPFPPTASVGPSSDMNIKGWDTTANESLMPVTSGEPLHRRQQNFAPGSYFPFCPPPPTASGRGLLNSLDRSGASFSSFMEKLVLPDLAHEYIKPQPVIVDPSSMKPHTDLLPSLSLSPNMEYMNCSPKDLPNVPILPNFRQQPIEALKQKQLKGELPPILDLSQLQATYSGSLPENHKKVLDNIMMRTRFATDRIVKKRPKADAWSEEELDALWIGVRRHGRGNWDAMLRDPKLKFSRHRTSGDLSARWPEEQCKLVDGPAALASSNSASFLGISDGMMTRALLGSKFSSLGAEPPKFRSHLTDIQLGHGDRTPGFPLIEPTNHFSAVNDSCSPLPAWEPDKFRASFTGDVFTGPFDMLDKLKLPLDQPLQQHTPLPGSTFASLNKNIKAKAIGVDDIGSSKANKLPHWLREAVSDPPSRPAGPDLPPTVSAIAHSVRVLYGEDKPAIPPFTIPGPPPCQPKDPRKSLKKKKNKVKLHGLRQVSSEIASPIQNSVPPESPLMAAAPSLPVNDPNIIFPSLHLNLNSPSSPSFSSQVNQSDTTLALSPQVVRSVASCMASVPCKSTDPDKPSPSCQRIQLPASQELETLELDRKGEIGDLKGIRGKRKASHNSLLGGWGKLANDRGADSGESSKTLPNPCHADQVETEEISSEEIVSIGHQNEQGP